MLVLLASTAAPLVACAVVFLSCRSRPDATESSLRHPASQLSAESRWEGLSAEVARLERQRALSGSDPAARRRHLAYVLPADARR